MSAGSTSKPKLAPETHFGEPPEPLWIQGGYIWAPLRQAWLLAKPEELVRQRFIYVLHTEYGYALEQMAQERRTMHGHHSPKADVLVCASAEALTDNRDYILCVELKAEEVPIIPTDYWQGESYARAVGCEFLVMHNERETVYFRLVAGAPGARVGIEDVPRASDWSDQAKLDRVRSSTKAFTRDEFRRLLKECHDLLRNNHKFDPGKSFDEMSKVLFMKMHYERGRASNRFTTDYVREYQDFHGGLNSQQLLEAMFADTRSGFEDDELFADEDKLSISFTTFKTIVGLLERFNLSKTADDVKGIAFEGFLGETFRGDLGQFFTPRPVVDFMVQMLDPQPGELICDPASGTGGFLIASFDHVRARIEAEVEHQKDLIRADAEVRSKEEGWSDEDYESFLEAEFSVQNEALQPELEDSAMWRLSKESVFGSDAEQRAARTSKMNMIMHGDGHGGIYYHDGLLDWHGIYTGRFDVVLTNPPFGATVTSDQIVGTTDQTRVVKHPGSGGGSNP